MSIYAGSKKIAGNPVEGARISTIMTVKTAADKSGDSALAPTAVELYVCTVSVIDTRFENIQRKTKIQRLKKNRIQSL
jgi:hypothetical protein